MDNKEFGNRAEHLAFLPGTILPLLLSVGTNPPCLEYEPIAGVIGVADSKVPTFDSSTTLSSLPACKSVLGAGGGAVNSGMLAVPRVWLLEIVPKGGPAEENLIKGGGGVWYMELVVAMLVQLVDY